MTSMKQVEWRRTALVTGGGRGIGQGISLALGKAGFDVAILYRSDRSSADRTAESLRAAGVDCLLIEGDTADLACHQKVVDQVMERWGRLDWLINNAGVAPRQRQDLMEATPEEFDRVLAINLRGPYFLSQCVARAMLQQPETEFPRGIVNISSISAETASPERGQYCISKAGIAMMTKLFAVRLAPHGLLVYEVRPGIIASDMTAAVREKYDRLIFEQGLLPQARWGTPEDVGKAVVAAVTGAFPYSPGLVLHVDGGFQVSRL